MISTKTCKKCGVEKPADRFGTFKSRTGEYRIRGTCMDCREQYHQIRADELVEYRRNYNAKKRSIKRQRDYDRRIAGQQAVYELKKAPCTDCGRTFPPVAMDFDHTGIGAKVRNVSNLVGGAYKLELILAEIAKCELVCACCHRIRTFARRQHLSPSKVRR